MHVERVTRAIALLRKVHIDGLPFDLRDWFSDPDNVFDCGTAACAAGWMARDEWMQEEGLESVGAVPAYLTSKDANPQWLHGFYALEAFFDMPFEDVHFALSATRYANSTATANDVADRMQGWLHANEQAKK